MAESTGKLDIYLRAFAERAATDGETGAPGRPGRRRGRRASDPGWTPQAGEREVIVFDTEATTDTTQRLRFGVWRLCREILNADGSFERLAVREEGIVYADDLPARELAVLQAYAKAREPEIDPGWEWIEPVMDCSRAIVLEGRSWFVQERLFNCTYKRKVPVVAFNLPFDLSRLAVGWHRADGGGFALCTHLYTEGPKRGKPNPYRPMVTVKPIDGHRALIGFAGRLGADPADADASGKPYRGEFVDLYPLVLGLTGEKHSLASACRAMGCEVQKGKAEHGRPIDPAYIDYARRDVAATHGLYEQCRRELDRHPIDAPAHRVFSAAGIGKGYLRTTGVAPRLELQPDFDRDVLGAATSSYYGGEVAATIIGNVPVRYLDVLSMYPTVNVLMGLWGLVIAEQVQTVDTTAQTRALLDTVTIETAFDPDTWPAFAGIAQLDDIDPDHPPVLPVRALYNPGAGAPTIGRNALSATHSGWYAIPDLVASKLATGHAPQITRALRFKPQGHQPLRPVSFRGEVQIDPDCDFFAALIEERQRLKRKPLQGEQERWRSQGLKITANGTSYGISIEMLRDESPAKKPTPIEVHTGAGNFTTDTSTPERPRHYCFPPVATLITAGARLILAMIEREVRDAGGTIAYCDTDSVAIPSIRDGGLVACPGGPERTADATEAIRALPWATVDAIAEKFAALNPYDPQAVPGSILQLEAENTPEQHDADPQLYAFILGAKRYALYNLAGDGRVIVRKCSEHGLGMRLDPTNPDAPVSVAEDDKEDEVYGGGVGSARPARGWVQKLWRYLIERHALGRDVPEPAWFGLPALCKLTVTRPDLAERLTLSPLNFCLVAQAQTFQSTLTPSPGSLGSSVRLVAPFERDPRRWKRMRWTDAATGRPFKIATGESEGYVTSGVVYVKSYRDMTAEFLSRPEAKFATPDGRRCPRGYRGLLVRRTVTPSVEVNIGKEGNHIEDVEAGLLRAGDVLNRYTPHQQHDDAFDQLVRPLARAFPPARVAQESGLSARTVERIRAGDNPTAAHRAAVTKWAIDAAGAALRAAGKTASTDPRHRLAAWAALPKGKRGGSDRRCAGCGKPLTGRQRKYCGSPACESRARRGRAAKPPAEPKTGRAAPARRATVRAPSP